MASAIDQRPPGAALRAYLLASSLIPLAAPGLLRRRLARGKEDPARWIEKLGRPGADRPDGRVVWLHAVGLGEVLALRGLIAELAAQAPDLSFLITSTARSSAQVMGANLPPRTQHQFLPLDAPAYLSRFLDHWKPDLSVWAEQEIWPGAVMAAEARGIPLAMVNARISADSHDRRRRARGLFADLLSRFALVAAQDEASAARLADLGARGVQVTGSLKSAAPPLAVDPRDLGHLRGLLEGRRIWVAASTHAGDEAEVLAAFPQLAGRFLILAPRDTGRATAIAAALTARGIVHVRRSLGQAPGDGTQVLLADSYGEMGLWYRLAEAALIGGGFDRVGGHNPWEAAILGCAILHGPDTANFSADYRQLEQHGAARCVAPGGLAAALTAPDLSAMALRAKALAERAQGSLGPLAGQLLQLMQGA